jgi:hypothetical protein
MAMVPFVAVRAKRVRPKVHAECDLRQIQVARLIDALAGIVDDHPRHVHVLFGNQETVIHVGCSRH